MTPIYLILGLLLILIGLPLMWTPIPLGLILTGLGLALILARSRRARAWLRRQRGRHPRLDRWLHQVERLLPGTLGRILAQTAAGRDD